MRYIIILAALVCQMVHASQGWTPYPQPAAQPLIKTGSCPSGYRMSGNYCVPNNSETKPAVPKVGSCPSGYRMSGDYCLKN